MRGFVEPFLKFFFINLLIYEIFNKCRFLKGLKQLDQHLLDSSFIAGFEPTDADTKVFRALKEQNIKERRPRKCQKVPPISS